MWRIKYDDSLHKWAIEHLEKGKLTRMLIMSSSKEMATEIMKAYAKHIGE